MKVLITGGAGFIGSNVADRLIEADFEVIVVDNLENGSKSNINRKAKFLNYDICDSKLSGKIRKLGKIDAVIHNAALIKADESFLEPERYFKVNVLGTLNALDAAKNNRASKFIFASSGGAVYGIQKNFPSSENSKTNPINPYGASKLIAEECITEYCRKKNISPLILRYSNVYGPRQKDGVISIFSKKIKENEEIVVNGDGKQTRDFVFVRDIAELNINALKTSREGIFNASSSIETSVITLISIIEKISQKKPKISKKDALNEVMRSCLDNRKAKKELGWTQKYSLKEGIMETFNYVINSSLS